MAGLDTRNGVQYQKPYSCPSALNCIPFAKGRERGGSRPGIARVFGGPAVDGSLGGAVTMINGVTYVPGAPGSGVGLSTRLVVTENGASSNNVFWADPGDSDSTLVTGTPVVNQSVLLNSTEYNQKLYIADHGEDESSSGVSFVPKIFDPEGPTFTAWTSSSGTTPKGCPLICTWRDRIVLAGGVVTPNDLLASAQGDPLDWDFSSTLSSGAFAISATSAGALGDRITALAPHADNCLMIGCANSIWLLQGDPKYGGAVKSLSQVIGVLDRNAFCVTPEGKFVFLSRDGLYACEAGCKSLESPVSISREKIPQELLNIDVTTGAGGKCVSLVYDLKYRGIFIFVTPRAAGANGANHWFFDWTNKSFWPIQFADPAFDPWCVHSRKNYKSDESVTLLGCADGYLRKLMSTNVLDDEGEDDEAAFTSSVVFGPFSEAALANETLWNELFCVLSEDSAKVTWKIYRADSAEAALNKIEADTAAFPTYAETGSFRAGRSNTVHPRVRGAVLYLQLSNTRDWAFETAGAILEKVGRVRV